MSEPVALAVAAHPDDIEFMMTGTLLLLGQAGYKLHMINLASGCCGSMDENRQTIATRRLNEAREAARVVGAKLHDPIADDVEVFYTKELVQKMCAVVRIARPTIMLLPSPEDYMEDHMTSSRLAVTAAFVRGMPNFLTAPPRNPTSQPVTLYHALPYGLRDRKSGWTRPRASIRTWTRWKACRKKWDAGVRSSPMPRAGDAIHTWDFVMRAPIPSPRRWGTRYSRP